jgi:hypothetical protein
LAALAINLLDDLAVGSSSDSTCLKGPKLSWRQLRTSRAFG